MKLAPEKLTAIAYLLPIAAIGGIWYILLFVGNDPNPDYDAMLHMWLFELPGRLFIWWLIFLPAICLAMAISYLTAIPKRKVGALVLCGLGLVASVAAWLTVAVGIAICVTLPLFFSLPRAKWHLTTRSSADLS
jgi:hypothetical protein